MGPKLEDFEVISVVGTGTSGTVRKVRRCTDGRVLVWKELHYANMTEPEKQVSKKQQLKLSTSMAAGELTEWTMWTNRFSDHMFYYYYY